MDKLNFILILGLAGFVYDQITQHDKRISDNFKIHKVDSQENRREIEQLQFNTIKQNKNFKS